MNLVSTMPSTPSGTAGRTNYAQWDKVTNDLLEQTEAEEAAEKEQAKQALGHDKYAHSEDHAAELQKAAQVQATKQRLEQYQQRERAIQQEMKSVFGEESNEETKSTDKRIVRLTRNDLEAGKRVLTLSHTTGASLHDTIVLTRDLSLLESQMPVNAQAKSYATDVENDAPSLPTMRSIYGLIKVFGHDLTNVTLRVQCKLIAGTIELHNCRNVRIVVEESATVATLQLDLCEDVKVEFHDAPSGKNPANATPPQRLYWGDDADDRIYHAGVRNMTVQIHLDGVLESETKADYIADGAEAVGNAVPEEMQFITSVVNQELATERVVRSGSTTGKNARAMTQRELEAEQKKRDRAAELAVAMAEDMIKIQDKDGNLVTKVDVPEKPVVKDPIEEIYSPATAAEIKDTVAECEQNKARGNEAFGAGEYGQAILLYSLALDKSVELPDLTLFPRDVVFSNRAACFLKLGQHEKAEEDAKAALDVNPDNLKALFRHGLALHAMGRYFEALPILAKAHEKEPHNKQIKQALQFCDVRVQQEHRKRMEG